MIKHYYSIEVTCRGCNEIIRTNEVVAIANTINIGILENLMNISDDYEWGKKLGSPYLKYTAGKVDEQSEVFRKVNYDSIIRFPSKFPEDVQNELYKLRNQLNSGEYHLKCYSEPLRKLNQLLELKAFA